MHFLRNYGGGKRLAGAPDIHHPTACLSRDQRKRLKEEKTERERVKELELLKFTDLRTEIG